MLQAAYESYLYVYIGHNRPEMIDFLPMLRYVMLTMLQLIKSPKKRVETEQFQFVIVFMALTVQDFARGSWLCNRFLLLSSEVCIS